jgi:hypothetical protein
LRRIINDLNVHTAAQSSGQRGAQQSTTSKAATRDELWRDLEAISCTARSMAFSNPGIEDKFRLPSKPKAQDLLSFARSVAVDAVPFNAEFIRRGLPADFLEDLDDDIEAFERAITGQIQGTEAHVAASAAIEELIDEGIRTLRELDLIMRNIFADDPAALAQWLSARRVERAPRKRKKAK